MRVLPAEILARLDGRDATAGAVHGLHESHRLTTTDADGWPRTAQLSDGEVMAMPDGSVRLCLWPAARTAANVRRDGRALLSVVAAGTCWDLRLLAEERPAPPGAPPFAYFLATAESTEMQRANYATVERGVSFRLLDAQDAPARWSAQLDALRRLA